MSADRWIAAPLDKTDPHLREIGEIGDYRIRLRENPRLGEWFWSISGPGFDRELESSPRNRLRSKEEARIDSLINLGVASPWGRDRSSANENSREELNGGTQ